MKKKIFGLIAGILMMFFLFTAKNSKTVAKSVFKSAIKSADQVATPYPFKNTLKVTGEDVITVLDNTNKVRGLNASDTDNKETEIFSYGSTGLEVAFQSMRFLQNTENWYKRELSEAKKQQNYAYEKELKSNSFLQYLDERKRYRGISKAYQHCRNEINQETEKEINLDNHINHMLLSLQNYSIVLHVEEIKELRKGISELIKVQEETIQKRIRKLKEERMDSIKN